MPVIFRLFLHLKYHNQSIRLLNKSPEPKFFNHTEMYKKGVIYVCVNSRNHLKECIHSVKSLRRHNPGIKVCLFTNLKIKDQYLFNSIVQVDKNIHPLKEKVNCILKSPFVKTLYIDTDTSIQKSIDEIFSVLDFYDIAIAHGPNIDYSRRPPVFHGFIRDKVFNTGVIAIKKSDMAQEFLNTWKVEFSHQTDSDSRPGHYGDQHYFNMVLNKYPQFSSNLKIFPLDNRLYNAVRWLYLNLPKEEREIVVIRHWHDLHLNNLQWKVKEYYLFTKRILGLNGSED